MNCKSPSRGTRTARCCGVPLDQGQSWGRIAHQSPVHNGHPEGEERRRPPKIEHCTYLMEPFRMQAWTLRALGIFMDLAPWGDYLAYPSTGRKLVCF